MNYTTPQPPLSGGTNVKNIILLITIFFAANFLFAAKAKAEDEQASILDLQNQIQNKSKQVNEIQDKIAAYEKQIDGLQDQAASLKGHINLLDSQINRTEDEINLANNQIQETELEIKKLALNISLTEQDVAKKLEEMKLILEEINSLDEDYLTGADAESRGILDIIINFFKVIIKYNSWSEYEKTVEDTTTINDVLKQKRDKLQDLQASLEANRKMAESKATELDNKKSQLQGKQQVLASEKTAKRNILDQTQANEQKYEDLLQKAADSQKALSREVTTLKEEVRQKIAALQQGAQNLNAILSWPVPYRRVTATFHDPTYPYRRYFEHNAIDIACPQGTPIYAPAAGYVDRAVNAGYGYNYISVIHTEKMKTGYGHVSGFAVSAGEFVKAGQIIGYTGGMPGTPGAGYLTTGPHLHFEVYLSADSTTSAGETYSSWSATNPLSYLP